MTKLAVRFLVAAVALCAQTVSAQVLHPLEASVAITDPAVLREMEKQGLGIGAYMNNEKAVISNATLSGLPAFKPVFDSLARELKNYEAANSGTGVGTRFGKRLFDVDYLTTGLARFALVGVINRMDRGYAFPEACGETRLIYRLAYRVENNGEEVFSRLPMTINLVLKARGPDSRLSCAEIARRWLSMPMGASSELVKDLLSDDGPLASSLRAGNQALRLELNMQIVRWPAAVRPDFGGHAEYLFKVYDWVSETKSYRETTLENQIDRDKLAKSPELMKKLKAWMLDPANVAKLDSGTLIIPEEFLAKRAISTAPGGLTRSGNRPFFKLFDNSELEKAIARVPGLMNIKSVNGFNRRLTDVTCAGCHQTRAIGGFHFMGRDPLLKYPGNSVYVPGSAHFFGDLPRRQDILKTIAQEKAPDYSKGFSSRPQTHRSGMLKSSGLMNGWGAHCSNSNDPSFKDWSCGEGLICKVLLANPLEPGIGVCMPDPKGKRQIGDPMEAGTVNSSAFGADKYTLGEKFPLPDPAKQVASPMSSQGGQKTGGFPNGAIRTKTCDDLPKEAVCGSLPAAKSGFNDCVASGKNFVQCIREFAAGVGLRGCDTMNPCRDDYICSESYEKGRGACVPPYFLFQFRVDGHPIK